MKKRFQILFSTLLLLSISWQCAAKTAIYLNFKRRQDKLAETVCENRDVPGSCCKAKCYLDKEIKKEEKRQADFPSSLKEKSGKTELFSGHITFSPLQHAITRTVAFHYNPFFPERAPAAVFHPPSP